MSMIFCRGCGKQIHETAQNCPQCGALQGNYVNKKDTYHWSFIAAFVSGVLAFSMAMTEPNGRWDSDAVLGGMILGAIPIAFGIYSFTLPINSGRWMSITGLILGIFVFLASLGSK